MNEQQWGAAGALPRTVHFQASPKSRGGRSLFDFERLTWRDADAVASDPGLIRQTVDRLSRAGFVVDVNSSELVGGSGPPELVQRAFNCALTTEERPVIKEGQREDTATFVECPQTDMPGLIDTTDSEFADLLEGVAIEEPRYYFATEAAAPALSPVAPVAGYWHLDVPGDVSLGCDADRAHRMGVTGAGVRVVMVDSGHFSHPFFAARGYDVNPVVLGPGAAAPEDDESGHGTAESANVFAVAPDVDFTMVKMDFTNTVGAFNTAVQLNPHIISSSWGSDKRSQLSAADRAMAAAIAVAVSRGIVVVFSAGNGHFGFPGQHPDVISAGGAFLDRDGSLRASDYSSGFASEIFPGRAVPDVSGLVGMRPGARYILLPLQPGDEIDRRAAGGVHPEGDETSPGDGWAAISGTSAAAPQIAGACALVRQANSAIAPPAVREALRVTARDVTAGSCFPRDGMNHAAALGPDLATGAGLIDAYAAVVAARRQ